MANKQHKHEHGTCMTFFPHFEGSIYQDKFSKKGDLSWSEKYHLIQC